MAEVPFLGGDGRLLAVGRWVVFALEADSDLFELFSNDDANLKRVGAHIFANDLALAPFVAIDTDSGAALIFGDIDVTVGSDVVNGASVSPWVERVVSPGDRLMVGDTGASDTWLKVGCVPAAAFAVTIGSNPVVAPSVTEGAESRPDEEVVASTNDAELSPHADPELAVVQEAAADPDDGQLPITPTPTGEADSEAAWDPLADPGVDLEQIGVVEFVDSTAEAAPASEPLPDGDAGSDVPPEPMPDVEPEGDATPPGTDDRTAVDDTVDGPGPRAEAERRAPLPPPPRPVPIMPPADGVPPQAGSPVPPPPGHAGGFDANPLKSAPTLPAPMPRVADAPSAGTSGFVLRFDDGQTINVDVGAYIGRHPTKKGLPDRYQSVTIRGEHVSRVHWGLVVEGGVAIVSDLGSSSGTEIESNGSRIPVPAEGMTLSVGATVHFADRWARLETE